MTTANDRETTLLHTDDLYAAFPEEIAALARAGEASLTRELHEKGKAQPALALELPETLHAYRKVALTLLEVVSNAHGTVITSDVTLLYVREQLDRECSVLLGNAEARFNRALREVGDLFRNYISRHV